MNKGGAPDMANNPNYKQFVLSKGGEVQERLERGLISARQKGYSVVEIARICDQPSAIYAHRALVKHGLLKKSKTGKKPQGFVVPEEFAKRLKIVGLSLSLWCAGWGLSEAEALDGLNNQTPAFMAILKRDFPGYFKQLTGIDPSDFSGGPGEREEFRATIELSWDGQERVYVAEIKDIGVYACGRTPQAAAYTALTQKKVLQTCNKLESLTKRI